MTCPSRGEQAYLIQCVFCFCRGVCGATWCKCSTPQGCRWLAVSLGHRFSATCLEENRLVLSSTTQHWKPVCGAAMPKLCRPPAVLGSLVLPTLLPRSLGSRASPNQIMWSSAAIPFEWCTSAEKWYSGSWHASVELVIEQRMPADHRKHLSTVTAQPPERRILRSRPVCRQCS